MQIYLVGGAVRDQLLDYPVYDKDWVVVGASAEEMLEQGFQPVGQDFPVFIHPDSGEEYALARTERKSGKGYTGFQYHASKAVTLEEDLLRRDLTINAMAMDDAGNIVDPYNGQSDLKYKLLRHVSPAFSEDPLRVLRVARFASRYHHLGFQVADDTLSLMKSLSQTDELEHLTAERVWKEFERALGEISPQVFLQVLQSCAATLKVFPELHSQFTDTVCKAFTEVTNKTAQPETRFACLLTLCGEIDIAALCDRLKTPKAYKELALQCQQQHQALSRFDYLAPDTKLQIISQLDLIRRPQRLEALLPCVEALHSDISITTLNPILESINQIQPKQLMQEGFKGPELGKEIEKRRLQICESFS
ncbi:hypothetical protein [Neptuniibacter sp.]|uniref:hypothetical protein n=1 Tax=Neptuniibacter sp. TaxID=1962643 RepID=UPI002633D6DF|nr:hypothetical protein [Neptuniibacter sp.]MCP4594999.1 hypothetical protein [Neptuniibacter sp.]